MSMQDEKDGQIKYMKDKVAQGYEITDRDIRVLANIETNISTNTIFDASIYIVGLVEGQRLMMDILSK